MKILLDDDLSPDIKANKPRKSLCLSEMRRVFCLFVLRKREREDLKLPNGLPRLSLMFLIFFCSPQELLCLTGMSLGYELQRNLKMLLSLDYVVKRV